jgi:hypothetical protein
MTANDIVDKFKALGFHADVTNDVVVMAYHPDTYWTATAPPGFNEPSGRACFVVKDFTQEAFDAALAKYQENIDLYGVGTAA